MKGFLEVLSWILIWFLLGSIILYDQPKIESRADVLELRIDSLEANVTALSQNDSTLTQVINQLYRKIKALEVDTVKGKKK